MSSPAPVALPAAGESILVVDDDPFSRTLLRRLLENRGYRIVCVEDGAGAPREGGEAVELKVALDDDPIGEVAPDGTFTITNGRNGFSKTYKAR